MTTKKQLAKIYMEFKELHNEKCRAVAEKSRLDKAILQAALSHQYAIIPELVIAREQAVEEAKRAKSAGDNRHAKLAELGYSMTDAKYYATGYKPAVFFGPPITIKPAR